MREGIAIACDLVGFVVCMTMLVFVDAVPPPRRLVWINDSLAAGQQTPVLHNRRLQVPRGGAGGGHARRWRVSQLLNSRAHALEATSERRAVQGADRVRLSSFLPRVMVKS